MLMQSEYQSFRMPAKTSRNCRAICEIFNEVQHDAMLHEPNLQKLGTIYKRADFKEFCEWFNKSLIIPWSMSEHHQHIDNVLEFAAKFAVTAYKLQETDESEENDGKMCPFLEQTFQFTLKYTAAKGIDVRFHTCKFIFMLLKFMGKDCIIDDDMYNAITQSMTDRLIDKSSKVRIQAVFAVQRLQDPSEEHCPVIKMYIYHLTNDPYPKVRQAVLSTLGKNAIALRAVLIRTRDINNTVRKMAYEYISKITVRSLTIAQRETLLNDGLKDRAEIVSKTVKNVLLPSWLQYFQGDYVKLLRGLDAETCTEIVVLALNILLKQDNIRNLLEYVPVDPETKLVPFDKLSGEVALYWRCLIQHIYRESLTDEEDLCIPELTTLCEYIQQYLKILDSKGLEISGSELLTQRFVLLQLIEIAKTYDLADEFGRTNLKNLILDTVMSDHCDSKVTESIVQYLEIVVPDVDSRLNYLARVISDLSAPVEHLEQVEISEQDERKKKLEIAKMRVKLNEIQEEEYTAIKDRDFIKAQSLKEEIESIKKIIEDMAAPIPVTMTTVEDQDTIPKILKRLEIICSMAAAKSVKTLTPTLRTLFEDQVLPNVEHENDEVHIMALKAIAICCLLDGELAKKHIMMYFLLLSVEQNRHTTWSLALQAIFDLLLCYGLEFFNIVQNNDNTDITENKSTSVSSTRHLSNIDEDLTCVTIEADGSAQDNGNLVQILISLLDNEDPAIRTLTTEGLCKLILNGRIIGSCVLSRLIILLYNPVNKEDAFMCQCLCSFFREFVVRIPDSVEVLEQVLLPTLKTIMNAPDASPLQAIDPYNVAKFILTLTRNRSDKPGTEFYTTHNNLAFAILAEALHPMSVIDQEVLLKSLKDLDIRIEDDTLRDNLLQAADKILDSINQSDKRLCNYVRQFKIKVNAIRINDEHPEEDTDKESVDVDK